MSANNNNTPPATPSKEIIGGGGGGGVSSSLISPGLTSSLHGSATTFGTPRGGGLGSAFQSPGVTSSNGGYYGMGMGSSSTTPCGMMMSTPGCTTTTTPGGGGARGDRRSKLVRERSRSSAAFATAATSVGSVGGVGRLNATPGNHTLASIKALNSNDDDDDAEDADSNNNTTMHNAIDAVGREDDGPALFTSFCYRGMEVIFTAINSSYSNGSNTSSGEDERRPITCHLMGIHARTRVPFQRCVIDNNSTITQPDNNNTPKKTTSTTIPETSKEAAPVVEIVQLTSHPTTGYIYAADNYGNIHSFHPERADPMAEAYGKFRWQLGSVANCREVFGHSTPFTGATASIAKGVDITLKASMSLPNTLSLLDSGEDGEIEVCDTFSIDKPSIRSTPLSMMAASASNEEGDDTKVAVCFHRRRRKRSSSPSQVSVCGGGSSPGKISSAGVLKSSYPLNTDGQPPLPDNAAVEEDDEYGVMICASMTEKRVLVVHRDQLAIFDFSTSKLATPPSVFSVKPTENQATARQLPPPSEALLLWTHKLQGSSIDHASISGDGCAIALALRGEGAGVPYPFGVRTFVRDKDDGSRGAVGASAASSSSGGTGNTTSGDERKASNAAAASKRSGSSGKPPIHHRRTGSGMQSLPVHQSPPLPANKHKPNIKDGSSQHNVSVEDIIPPANPPAASGPLGAPSRRVQRGILYKPAQFLVHSAPVTRLAFRGHGTSTSSAQHNTSTDNDDDREEEGNDLLLTTCASDCSVRIFSQNSWRQLMHWNSPPRSRADWVRGISAANLGDLDASPTNGSRNEKRSSSDKKRGGRGEEDGELLTPIPKDADSSTRSQGRQSFVSDNASVGSEASGGINHALLASTKNHHSRVPTPGSFPSHSVPGTHAGAWIAELTFRNAFPALRLSRLSYMKTGGDDALPAHFESVAAILPPGSISEEVVLDTEGDLLGECRMDVEGIWPTWDPWEPDLKSSGSRGGGGGGKQQAEGGHTGGMASESNKASNNPLGSTTPNSHNQPPTTSMAPRWLGDGSDLGGSHMPPSELRITTSNNNECSSKCLTQIEMPLWGDKDFGAMEFGAPLRHVMLLPTHTHDTRLPSSKKAYNTVPQSCLDYESGSKLCANSSVDGRSIELVWRRHGAVNLEEITLESENDSDFVRRFQDLSLTPLPLALPSLTLPGGNHHHGSSGSDNMQSSSATTVDKHAVSSLHWWPDENYGGPPRLVAVTIGGSIIVYEMPPPWSALEPPMPAYDPFDDEEDYSRGSSVDSDFMSDEEGGVLLDEVGLMEADVSFGDDSNASNSRSRVPEYEVTIAPHPDFGLGLRLEAQAEGMPPVAGSFKKHPLSGGRLPAERCGVIALGDELLAVNDVTLEGKKFEDAIATVRQIGFDSFGSPLQMRFRRCRRKKSSTLGSSGGSGTRHMTYTSDSRQGLARDVIAEGGPIQGTVGSGASHATVEVGADAEIQQGFGRIIAIVRDGISLSSDPHTTLELSTPPAMLLLPWNFGKGAIVSPKMYGGALILWAVPGSQRMIKAARLEAVLDIDPENARFVEMGSIDLDEKETAGGANNSNHVTIKSISYISSTENGWLVAVHDTSGNVSLLFIDTSGSAITSSNHYDVSRPSGGANITATFRHYPNIFNSYGKLEEEGNNNKHDPRDSFLLRSFSLELFGVTKKINCDDDGGCSKELTVWSALPQSMHGNSTSKEESQQRPPLDYNSETICIEHVPQLASNEVMLDFQWISSGFVDAFPWLVIFTASAAVVYHRSGVQVKWRPLTIFYYKEKLSSSGMAGGINPHTAYPHLITALRTMVLSNDEHTKRIKNDWSPESILATICTESDGASLALNSYVKGLFTWLSQWMNVDEMKRPVWGDGHGMLSNAPFHIVNDKTILTSSKEDDYGDVGENSASLMAKMTLDSTGSKKKEPQSEEEVLLSELQSALYPSNDTSQTNGQVEKPHNGGRSREFMMAMSYGGRSKPEKANDTKEKALPIPLKNLNKDELCCIWAIGEVLSDPPSFKKLDTLSQLALFCVSLMRRLLEMSEVESQKDSIKAVNSMPSYEGGRPTMMLTTQEQKATFDTVASAAMLSALMSDSQAKLLHRCRLSKGEKFTWETARSVGIPYWIRSDKMLISIAEEVAQTIYKSTKNVMDCALYYIAMRNMKKLRAIAATDRTPQGKKFLTFIGDHDFTSERGRNAAEKNAYSLLRKRKYMHAASFFLLAEPPMIKTALDVIKMQLKDASLALLVARLMENAPKSSSNTMSDNGGGLTIGGGFNLSSMGGGGGFATDFGNNVGASSLAEEIVDETVKFDCWEPKLGKSSRSVLLPTDPLDVDVCFESLQLLWLGRPDEAKLRLSHTAPANHGKAKKNCVAVDDLPFPPVFGAEESLAGATTVLKKANEIINFCTGPTLLKRMKPKKRVLWTSALLVSRALSRCGIEIPSMRILLQVADPAYKEEDESSKSESQAAAQKQSSTTPSPSSIFDSFDTAPPKPKAAARSEQPASSIFDSFDAAPPKAKPAALKPSHSNSMSSSIFDSYDAAPPPKSKPPKPTQSDPMSSSIFDSFDAAPQKPKPAPPKPPTQSDPMSSSIFDSFDAAPPKPKPPPKPAQSDPMSSSIFDSFDAAPQKPKVAAKPQPQTGEMSSSIFDSFDAAPPKPKPAAPKPSSIFDSFDTAPQKAHQKSSGRPPSSKAPNAAVSNEVEKEQPFSIPSCPTLWNEWRERLIVVVAARRFFRELARIISNFDGEPSYVAMEDFAQRDHPIIPTGAAEVLHNPCDSEGLLNSILKSLSELSTSFGINETAILEHALELLSNKRHPKRIVFSVILQCLLGRGDLAEDLVRDAASFQMNSSEFLGFSNDTIVDNRESRYYTSSLWNRRESSNVIWQLELCLWLNRGGAFDMSAIALKETLLAVRVGLAASAWGRCHLSLDTLIKAVPDCLMDYDAGKNLWRSMKIIVVNENTVDGIDGVTSGGWEFLVDCRREEATEMLRDGKTGQFLIRPHPQDPGVFTLSFKTNLVPTEPAPTTNYDEAGTMDKPQETSATSAAPKKVVKRDDVVQHAIIRLSDSGFRCGSFGPFATLVKLLHAVSDSLPFELRFSDPPIKGIISEKGLHTSPNSFLFRKLALHSKAQFFQFQSTKNIVVSDVDDCLPRSDGAWSPTSQNGHGNKDSTADGILRSENYLQRRFGLFSQLLFLTELRKQLCAVAAAVEDELDVGAIPPNETVNAFPEIAIDDDFDGSLSEGSLEADDEEALGVASRMVKPLLNWVRSREIDIVHEVTPMITHDELKSSSTELSVAINASGNEFELPPSTTHGDSMIRRMIQAGSGVDFRTLRVGEAGNSVIVVLFGKQDAIKWLMANQTGNDEAEAEERLKAIEMMRVIEPITSGDLSIPKSYAASHPSTESRYRFVDPWEVEALESRSGETASAALGRGRYQALSVGLIANSCEKIVRAAGGLHLLGLWSTLKGGITLTKALCSAHPSWERDAGGDLLMKKGFLMEPSPYDNSIRQHLYGNYLFRRLELPQRFLALVQVELLDLKNVTSPSGSSSLTAYALLRLKRQGSSAPLNHKARSLDSACTQARKISKSSGPNAAASWGSLVRFRFPLPEDVNCEGKSFDSDRESLFKGPPTCLQITVYEKKFMSDVELGGADVNLESLGSGGQIEEWVPLRAGKDGITWFARIRLSLRFELLCLDSSLDAPETGKEERCPSVGLTKIQKLSRLGAHEDNKGVKNSISTPDLMGYFGNMIY